MPKTTAEQIKAGIKSLIEQGQDRDSVNEIVGNSIEPNEFISVVFRDGIATVADDSEITDKFKITVDITVETLGEWFAVSWVDDFDPDIHVFEISGPFASRMEAIESECTDWCTGEPDDPTYHAADIQNWNDDDQQFVVEPRGPNGGETINVAVSQDKDSLPEAPE